MAKTYQSKTLQDLKYMAMQRLSQAFGAPSGATRRIAVTDTAQALPAAVLEDAWGNAASAVAISVEGADIRVAFGGTTPALGASPIGHIYQAGERIALNCPEDVASFRFINAMEGIASVLQVTAKY